MTKKRNSNGGRWNVLWIAVLSSVATHAIDHLFFCLRQNNRSKKAEEERKRRKAEEDAAQEKAQRQAEEDPESKLKQKDKDVRAYVFKVLRLFQTDPPQGERVCASEAEEKRYSRPPLVGPFVSKGDFCVLVSQPGVGKSILAFQMGDDIATGRASKLIPNSEGHQDPQPVFYWDAEMDTDDMKERYPEGLSNNFVRFPNCNYRDGFYLLKHICDVVSPLFTDATIVLDNWKALCAKISPYYFMTGLKKLQSSFVKKGARLTVIIVIHTTKEACKKYEVDLGDVAGAAEITRYAKTVLFVNPVIDSFGVVELHDAKRRTAKKNADSLFVLKGGGGGGSTENLHFECISEENLKQLVNDNEPDFEKKKPGKKSKFTEEDDRDIVRRLDDGDSAKDIAKDYSVTAKTIYGRAKRHRERNQ